MAKKKYSGSNRTMKFAQTCDSRECRSKYKDEIIKGFCEAVTTLHEVNFGTGEIKCLYCGKITKLQKNK